MNTRTAITCLFTLSVSAFAQSASITGRVTDATGASVPAARITVKALATNIETTADSNEQGLYSFPVLSPGRYDVTVTKSGFQTLREQGLALAVQQVARLDLALQVGQVSDRIEVQAQSIVLESETSTVGQVIQSKQITELPLLGRNTYALAMLVPGVRPSGGVNNLVVDQISTVSYAISGQRASANEFLLDGAPNSAASQNQPVINANPDMVQEFKVETNSFAAEYGRASGGVFNVITRSGSNVFHGGLYEFLRNDKLNANDFFANQAGQKPPPFKFNQFGGTLGGPVFLPRIYNGRNRTFFFVNVEPVRFVQGITFVGTTPRAAELSGDFSAIRNAAGAAITIYDPLTTSGGTRQPFGGNRIPAERLDPVARNVSKYFPTANASPTNAFTGVNNYARVSGNIVNKDSVSYRVDHHFSDKNRILARYSADDTPFVRAAPYGRENPGSPGTGPQTFGRRNTVVEDSHTFTPTLLGTFRYSFTRLSNTRSAFSEPFDIGTLGFPKEFGPQLVPRAFPNFGITGYGVSSSIPNIVTGGALGSTDIIRLGNSSHSAQATISKAMARHTLKFGFDFRNIQLNTLQTGANTPVFNFTAAYTQGPSGAQASAAAGHALASFLLGTVAGGTVTPVPALATSNKYYALFAQDSYRMGTRLTLNLGLRWEMETPRTDRFNQLTNFDFSSKVPLNTPGIDARGALTFVGVNGLPRTNTIVDGNNFAPRAGFAFQANSKTVIRGGSGLFFSGITGIGTGSTAFGISGFQATTTMVSSLDGLTPINFLKNPYPSGLVAATGSSQGTATLLGQSISFTDRSNVTPYSVQWNFDVQRELPGKILVEAGYSGSHGLKFPQNLALNQMPDSALALKDDLRTLVSNPFFGQISSGILAQRTVSKAQLLRPYPQFDGVTSVNTTWSSSIYHGLNAKAERRYANGLTVLGSYTYSKAIDYGIGTFAGEVLGGAAFQNNNNLRGERAPSTLDQTHRFIFNTVYEVPYLRNRKDIAGRVLGGWDAGIIFLAYTGAPIGMNSATNGTFSQGGGQRPNWSGVNPSLSNATPQRWFDTAQFTTPSAYTFGNSARTYSGLRTGPARNIDLSAHKNIPIYERLSVQFRAEFFNLFNTPRFDPPNISQGSAAFGVVSAMANQPRVVQFALKLMF
ncbi:MAG: TonB-dependent receptor [Candidatus Solibacter usitatus]|nr:TonB-dependent receptor [Candidatus Solibacter usitatus]